MDTTRFTVVFEVKDRAALDELYRQHLDAGANLGLRPAILSWGDQVTIPGEIADCLADIDPEWPDRTALRELVELAKRHNCCENLEPAVGT